MRALVCFETAEGQRCALDVAHVGGVLGSSILEPLPEPRAGVLGLLRSADRLTPVLGMFASTGEHVVLVQVADVRFGLMVGKVTGLARVHDEQIGPPPPGQARPVVLAFAGGAALGALVLDPTVLAHGLTD